MKDYFTNYYTKDTEIDITLFKILGTAGILISLLAGTQSIVTGISVIGGLTDYFAAFASILLLWFVDKTGKYVYGYIITSIGIFMILFSVLFFEMGGMEGSMPYFFAFGIVFVFLMFKGKLLVIMEILQVAVYTFVCVYSVLNPESVTPFASERERFIDQLTGILFSGVGIGLIFLAYIAQYRKQKLIADEANLAKSRFLANMSHEIRTPINMMMGMNEMIIREAESDTVKEYALSAEDAGKQLISVINQILQYAKLEVGKDELVAADYDFYKMTDSLADYFRKEAATKNISFNYEVSDDISPVLIGDMRKLYQILTNLLSNAIKYTREGSVSFVVRNQGIIDDAQVVLFAVSDTGIGINEAELSKIFESFERIDLLKNRNVEGTGLGLAIAQSLAFMMNTSIEVESVYGKGSTFSFLLRQKIGDSKVALSKGKEGESFVAPDAKILAVDDNAMNLNVLKSLLKKTMLRVDTAECATDCYDKCMQISYDLVLMDLMMPNIDGVEAMKYLRGLEPYREIPIVALTADVSAETEERLLAEGFDGYITKPIDWKTLEACLMEKLPTDLLIKTSESVSETIDKEQIEKLTDILKSADMELSEGLHYMGGDIIQYAKVAEFFIVNSEDGIRAFKEYIEGEDYDKAKYILHSLKGNAKNVGAVELHYLSKRLEKRCRDNDTEYVASSAELLIFEWIRVREGLKQFLEAFRPIRDSLEQKDSVEKHEGSFDEKIQELIKDIESCRQIPAIGLISELLEECTDGKMKERLEKTKELITKIEFEDAEQLWKKV